MHETGVEQRFVSHVEQVERVIAFVARRRRLTPDETDEFRSVVRLKVVEDDYAVFRKFEGRSSLQTYLTVVVQRLYLDYRTSLWGKWRPSAEAKRLGPAALLLERLTARDGLSFDEACHHMRTNCGVTESDAELYALSTKIPARVARRFTDDGALDATVSAPPAGDTVEQSEHAASAVRASEALGRAMAELPERDRLILQLRFEQGLQVSQIARMIHEEQKPLYRQLEQLLRRLRERLHALGVDRDAVAGWLGAPEVELPPAEGPGGGIWRERPSL